MIFLSSMTISRDTSALIGFLPSENNKHIDICNIPSSLLLLSVSYDSDLQFLPYTYMIGDIWRKEVLQILKDNKI